MINEFNLEFVGKVKADKPTSFADQAHWAKHGTNRSSKSAKSKSEIMEELSRERFPWEE